MSPLQQGPLHPVPQAYESMLLAVPIRDIMPLGQKSLISRLPRRGWVMVTVTATCSSVFMPESCRSAALTGKGKAGFAVLLGTELPLPASPEGTPPRPPPSPGCPCPSRAPHTPPGTGSHVLAPLVRGAGLPGSPCPGEQPVSANPQQLCQELGARGAAPGWHLWWGREGAGPCWGREGPVAELCSTLVAALCFCGQQPAKSGAGALPKMVKGRGAGLAAAQPGPARSCLSGCSKTSI